MKGKGNKLYSFYLPMIGSASSVAFSFDVMHPAAFRRIFGPFDTAVANALWFNAHIGIGVYLYTRRHMKPDSELKKLGFCVFGSVMFNFGTLLFLATLKNVAYDNDWFRVAVGVLATGGLLYTGKKYLKLIDEKAVD